MLQRLEKGREISQPPGELFTRIFLSRDEFHFQYSNVFYGSIQRWAGSLNGSDGIDDIHAADHLSEDGIRLIQMRGTAGFFVYFPLVGGYLSAFQPVGLDRVQTGV